MSGALKLEIVSTETIKPSSPTPEDRRTCKLSLLDQIIQHSYTPFLLFYQASEDHHLKLRSSSISKHLKDSLSEVLAKFYPLAGRLNNNFFIDCNDEGVTYLETLVINRTLSEILAEPDYPELDILIQSKPIHMQDEGQEGLPDTSPLLIVQANFFPCGGIALGISMTHKIADASTIFAFLKAWSDTSLGCKTTIVPDFNATSSRFPNSQDFASTPTLSIYEDDGEKYVAKRFVFEASKIAKLKDRARSVEVQQPTRVEAVTSLVWKSMMAASKSSPKPYMMLGSVNLRSRLTPPLPKYAFGNGIGISMATVDYETSEIPNLATLASRLRKVFVDTRDINNIGESMEKMSKFGPKERFTATSWCRFPAYEVDFGLGKPVWVTPAGSELCRSKLSALLDTSDGEGVDVLMFLPEGEMAILETDPEFLQFALPNPSPLKVVHKPSCQE